MHGRRHHPSHGDHTFIFLIDNVEGIARLPRHTASFLRSLTQDPDIGDRVAYVVTSSTPLSRLYPVSELREPSSFWGLFASELFIGGLMTPTLLRCSNVRQS